MREILFKAKRVDNGEWVEGDLVSYDDAAVIRAKGRYIGTGWHVVDSKTVCQYTGMRDRNGQRIFEGDILTHPDGIHFEVVFECQSFRAKYDNPITYSIALQIGDRGQAIVTGNIHDSTEETE